MHPRTIVLALAAIWAALVAVSLVTTLGGEADGDDVRRGLARIATFLTWQAAALAVAMVGAGVTRVATERGAQGLKLPGYLPLAASLFIVGALVAMIAFRVLVQPAFS
jgi:hypothetical protein